MAAVDEDVPTNVCPIRAGDRFRTRSGTRLTVLSVERDDRPLAHLTRERNGRTSRLRMPLADVRRRVRRGCWMPVPR